MGWWSHRSARRSSVACSRMLTMEYIIMAPADGARLAARKIAARCSSVTATGRSSSSRAKARVDERCSKMSSAALPVVSTG